MNKVILITICIVIIGCKAQKNTAEEEPLNPKAEVVKTKEERRKETIQLIPFKTKYNAVVGQKLEYTASVHGSVGSTSEVYSDEETIKLIDSKHKYDNPFKSEMSGGDAATVKYTFEAIKPGIGHVTIIDSYRGDLQNTYELEIIVE